MQAAEALRQTLTDEYNYLGIVSYAHGDGRAFFLYGCLDEVFKACVNITRWSEFLDVPKEEFGKPVKGDDKERHVHRVVIEAVIDEQEMWARKLNEILADLILFASTNDQPYYRLYLAYRQLDGYLGLQQDFEEFFACRSGNADSSVGHIVETIKTLEREVDQAKLWFLRMPVLGQKLPQPGFAFTSAKRRYIEALKIATSDQRLTLGVSYEMAHSRPSRSIHPNIGGPRHDNDIRDVDRNIGRLGLLAAHVAVAAHRLAGIEPVGIAKQLAKALESADAPAKIDSVIQSDFAVGDIVTAYGPDICEVVDKRKSQYGYTSYKVRFLLRPMLPELPEDWYPARYVHLMMSRAELREGMVKALEGAGASPNEVRKIRDVSDADISAMLPRMFTEMERNGLLELMFRRPSLD